MDANLDVISRNLQRQQPEQLIETNSGTLRLRTIFSNFVNDHGVLFGSIAYEKPVYIPQIDAEPICVKSFKKLSFALYPAPHSYYLLCFANRTLSDATAGKMDKALRQAGLSQNQDYVVLDHYISSAFIEDFLRNHPNHTLKVCGWKNLDYVGVEKSTLHGSNIYKFNGAQSYDTHGSKSYVMVELHDLGLTVRISEVGIVTFYGEMSREDILDFLDNEIFPL